MVDEQDAVEMIDLVLHAGREQALAGEILLHAVAVEVTHRHPGRARHVGIMLGQRQAAFLVGHVLVGGLDDLGIGHQERAGLGVLAVDVEHDDALQYVDLRSGEADAGRRVHRLQHVVHELAHVGIDGGHGLGLLLEAWIGRGEDRLDGHGA